MLSFSDIVDMRKGERGTSLPEAPKSVNPPLPIPLPYAPVQQTGPEE